MGFTTTVYFFFAFFLIKKNIKFEPTNFNTITGGTVAGFLAGLIGTGGAVRGMTMAAFKIPQNIFKKIVLTIILLVGILMVNSFIFDKKIIQQHGSQSFRP